MVGGEQVLASPTFVYNEAETRPEEIQFGCDGDLAAVNEPLAAPRRFLPTWNNSREEMHCDQSCKSWYAKHRS
jgi:hypothetical protein